MTSLFKGAVIKTIDSLIKHLDALSSDDEDKQTKAIIKLTDIISQIHFILYGNNQKDPNPDHITKLVPKLLQPDTDLFCKITIYIHKFEFEAKKQTAGILNYIIRRCNKYQAHKYIKNKTDKYGHNVIIDCLLRGYHNQQLAQSVGSVLQEMAKRPELAPMLLNTIHITRKTAESKVVNHETKNENEIVMEERDVINELFILVQKPSFLQSSDAYKTLQLLLTRNKKSVLKYLQANYDKFFAQFNALIQSDDYVTQRQFLSLLSDLLLERINFKVMMKYVAEKDNLQIIMTLLQNDKKTIAHEAFHIFKIFVANPNKAKDIHIVLWKNKEKKLIHFLENFLTEKARVDEKFAEEKRVTIEYLKDLPIPDKILEYRRKKQRAKSQAQAVVNNGNENDAHKSGTYKSKSIPNVKPPLQTQIRSEIQPQDNQQKK